MKLNFFSSLLILLLVTMSAKGVVLLAKIQDQTKYTFVTQANSSLIETAYAKTEAPGEKKEDVGHVVAPVQAPHDAPTNTNLPNFDSGFSKDEIHHKYPI